MRSSRRDIYRRRLAYPIITLLVAGGVLLYQRGMIATSAPASTADYVAFATLVMGRVRSGEPLGELSEPAIGRIFTSLAPASIVSPEGGSLAYAAEGPVDPTGARPWAQSVLVTVPSGEGVALTIEIRDGASRLTGLAQVRGPASASDGAPSTAGPGAAP